MPQALYFLSYVKRVKRKNTDSSSSYKNNNKKKNNAYDRLIFSSYIHVKRINAVVYVWLDYFQA